MKMSNLNGVADNDGLPGQVLDPNSASDSFTESPSGIEQFGQELKRPDAVDPKNNNTETDAKRFEYHQSRADKAEAKLKEVETLLKEKSKNDPLIELIQRDEETFQFVQNRLTGKATTAKPLEPPQRPNSYNEVEAYSNPDSESFKYRKAVDGFRDAKIAELQNQNQILFQQREQEKQFQLQQKSQQESMQKFKQEIVSKGIADNDFAEFFQLVNSATPDEMVDYFKWKKSQNQEPDNSIPNFRTGITRSASVPANGKFNKGPGNTFDIGDSILAASRQM
jgi:hypothetical protein